MNASRWRVWLTAGAIFCLGLCVGVGITTLLGIRVLRQRLEGGQQEKRLLERTAVRIGNDVTKALDLGPRDTARVRVVLEESSRELRRIRAHGAAEIAAEMRRTLQRIASELPPDKQEAFHAYIAKRYEKLGLEPPNKQSRP